MAGARCSCGKWIAGVGIALALVAAAAISQAGRFLEAPGSAPVRADILVVLGGEAGDRALLAARLFRESFAARLVVTAMDTSPREARPAILHWRAQLLAEHGVRMEQVVGDPSATNSWQEAVNTRRLMEAHGWRRALVVSDPYHMRRLSWAWSKAFDGSGLEFSLVASSPQWWDAGHWWRDERSALAVVNEYIKLAYYLVKY